MTTLSSHDLVKSIAQRLSDILEAQVIAFDDRGGVLASAKPPLAPSPDGDAFRVSVRLDGLDVPLLVRPTLPDEPISERLIQALACLLGEQAAAVDRLPNINQLKNQFIHSLLRGEIEDEEHVLREGQILGMDVSRPRSVLLIDASEFIIGRDSGDERSCETIDVQYRAQTVISSVVRFFSLPNATICAYIGNGEVAVLKASSTQDLMAWAEGPERIDSLNPSWANLYALKRAGHALLTRLQADVSSSVSIGIGRFHPGLKGLAWSFRDAQTALGLGKRVQQESRVHCLDSLGAAAFVGLPDEETKLDLATHLLTPLGQDEDLIETLQVFFEENCSPSLSSRRLSIHRNTLSYRLDKITSLTGLDPRQFDQAVQIRLALLLRSFVFDPSRDLELADAPNE
jgi:carbohydrate diacid regulator